MEFWGVEVKSGKPYTVELYEPRVIHLSQACLGEGKDKGNEPIYIYVTINGNKIVLGSLYPDKLPQQQFDLMFDKTFELSHSRKNGTVNFFGYECDQPDDESDSSDAGYDSEFEEDIPFPLAHEANGKPSALAAEKKAKSSEPEKDMIGDSDSSDQIEKTSSEDESDSDEDDSSDVDSSEDESDEGEDIPKKVEKVNNKRPAEAAPETPAKKAKLVTPKKSGGDSKKSVVHVDTPYPAKKAGKATSANQSKQKTPESSGSHLCKPCNRPFNSEQALESHSKAKHSGGK